MAENAPFHVEIDDFPTEKLRALFGPSNCFAQGNFAKTGENIKLDGNCRIVKFGKTRQGRNCMFVLDGDVSAATSLSVGLLFEFDHLGRVVDFRFGNGVSAWRMNIPNGTCASFGEITKDIPYAKLSPQEKAAVDAIDDSASTPAEKMLQKQKIMRPVSWGLKHVLKGSFQFVGCVRHDLVRGNDYIKLDHGIPCVSCVHADRELDETFEMTQDNEDKVQPYFEYNPITKTAKYGSKSGQYYDGEGFSNRFGNPGHESFMVFNSSGMRVVETRIGHSPYPRAIPSRLSANHSRDVFKDRLMSCFASVQLDLVPLRWLETHPLVFPSAQVELNFVGTAFNWIQELSTKFKHRVGLSTASLKSVLSSRHMSVAATLAPGVKQHLFGKLAKQHPLSHKQVMTHCKCTPTHRDPMCQNMFCPYQHVRNNFEFVWPTFEFHRNEQQNALLVEKMTIKERKEEEERQEDERRQAALLAEQQRRKEANKAYMKQMKELRAKNMEITRQLVEEKRARESAALAASAASAASPAELVAEPARQLRGNRTLVSASAQPTHVEASAPVRRRTTTRASAAPEAEPEARGVKRSTDSAQQKPTRRRAKGGSKSKSKSKRRFRK